MSGVILELQRAALDSKHSVSDLLRRALVIATKLGLADFEAWVRHELNGYPPGGELPNYRSISGFPMALNPVRGWVPIETGDGASRDKISRARLTTSVTHLESLLSQPKDEIVLRWPDPLAARFARQNPLLTEPVTKISRAAVVAVLEAVRNAVLDWSLKLDADGIKGDGLEFTARERSVAQAKQHIYNYYGPTNVSHVTATGDGATVNVSFGANDIAAIEELAKSLREIGDRLGLQREDFAEMRAELTTLEAQTKSPRPKSNMLKSGIETLVRILGTAAAKEIAEPLIHKAAELLRTLR